MTYKIGQRFIVGNRKQILVQVAPGECCFIGFYSGNRWVEPVKVENAIKVTRNEIKKMASGERWKLIRSRKQP